MKTKLILGIIALMLAFSSCQKCVDCVAYREDGTKSHLAQKVRSCSKVDIDAYESGTFTETGTAGLPIHYKCE